jgi:hypothetical protein
MNDQFHKPPAKATPLGIILIVGFVAFIVLTIVFGATDRTSHPPQPRDSWEAYSFPGR